MNGYRPRCGSVDAGSLKGGRRPRIKGGSCFVQHRGRLNVFTSIAPCGRHFKDTSSLKTWACTFMCCRIYSLHYLHFMWLCFGKRMALLKKKKVLEFARNMRVYESFLIDLFSCGWSVFFMGGFLCRCGSRIAEPSGGRGSATARCSRSGHTSPLPTSCLY